MIAIVIEQSIRIVVSIVRPGGRRAAVPQTLMLAVQVHFELEFGRPLETRSFDNRVGQRSFAVLTVTGVARQQLFLKLKYRLC